MCVAALDASSAASSGVDGAPPADSRLANSLQRGYFAQTFGQWEPIGSGGFGTVVKAWHLQEEKWYAVKLINARVRASETAEENHEAWSGPDVFGQLCALRSPHVVRYVRYWSELPSDLPCHAVERCPSPKVQTPPVALHYGGALPTQSVAATSTSALTESSTAASDCGFEWAAPSKVPTRGAPSFRAISAVSTASSPNCMHKVVILEQMEYCEGVTLQSWLANPELRPGLSAASHDGVLELFSQVVKGLRDLHEAGIVHCDVKPANILVTKQDAQIKFFDFGSARVLSHGVQRCGRAPLKPSEQAGSCTALGTPGYAPPEHCTFPALLAPPRRQCSESSASQGSSILRSRLASPGSDIYSAGVVLLELLMVCVMGGSAWATAMERADALAHLRSGCEGALPLAVVRQPGIEGWLRQLVLRMVVWDAEVRPSAQEVLDELEAGLWLASRHNPNVGMSHSRAPQLAAISCPLTAAHNPFIGFFLDHRRGGHL